MKKNIIIISLTATVVALIMCLIQTMSYIKAADDYINALETQFPEYIDTVSGSDAYDAYYN